MRFKQLHIALAGGGTGGHLYPGLAVAGQLQEQAPGLRVTFVGSGKPFERTTVEHAGFDYHAIRCRPWPRRAMEVLGFLTQNLAGYWAAVRWLGRERVSAVVGLGGYASAPLCRAAIHRGVPLLLLEQNAIPGRTTRWLARSADAVCLSLAPARPHLPASTRVHVTGNPIRSGFVACDPRSRQLLVLGGSGGARSLNHHVPKALYRLGERVRSWRVIHQSGPAEADSTGELYRKLGLPATVTAFIDEMPAVLAQTGLAICRAGGTTLAELAAAGVPALLLPYPHAADDHQRSNADLLSGAGGARLIDERDSTDRLDHRIAEALAPLLADPSLRARMSRVMQRFARPEAAGRVAALLLERITSPRRGTVAPCLLESQTLCMSRVD